MMSSSGSAAPAAASSSSSLTATTDDVEPDGGLGGGTQLHSSEQHQGKVLQARQQKPKTLHLELDSPALNHRELFHNSKASSPEHSFGGEVSPAPPPHVFLDRLQQRLEAQIAEHPSPPTPRVIETQPAGGGPQVETEETGEGRDGATRVPAPPASAPPPAIPKKETESEEEEKSAGHRPRDTTSLPPDEVPDFQLTDDDLKQLLQTLDQELLHTLPAESSSGGATADPEAILQACRAILPGLHYLLCTAQTERYRLLELQKQLSQQQQQQQLQSQTPFSLTTTSTAFGFASPPSLHSAARAGGAFSFSRSAFALAISTPWSMPTRKCSHDQNIVERTAVPDPGKRANTARSCCSSPAQHFRWNNCGHHFHHHYHFSQSRQRSRPCRRRSGHSHDPDDQEQEEFELFGTSLAEAVGERFRPLAVLLKLLAEQIPSVVPPVSQSGEGNNASILATENGREDSESESEAEDDVMDQDEQETPIELFRKLLQILTISALGVREFFQEEKFEPPADVFRPILELLEHRNPKVLEAVTQSLGKIAHACREQLIRAGTLEALSELYSRLQDQLGPPQRRHEFSSITLNSGTMVAGTYSRTLWKSLFWAFGSCLRDHPSINLELGSRILQSVLIPEILVRPNAPHSVQVLWSLRYAAAHDALASEVAESTDVLRLLVRFLEEGTREQVAPAIQILGELTGQDDETTQKVLDVGLLNGLQKLYCGRPEIQKDDRLCWKICWVVSNVSTGGGRQAKQLVSHGILDHLVKLLNVDGHPAIMKELLVVYNNLLDSEGFVASRAFRSTNAPLYKELLIFVTNALSEAPNHLDQEFPNSVLQAVELLAHSTEHLAGAGTLKMAPELQKLKTFIEPLLLDAELNSDMQDDLSTIHELIVELEEEGDAEK